MPIITVQFIEQVVATPEQKRRLIIELTDKFVEILGDVVRPFVYCIIQETPQQEWAIAGVPMPDLVYLTGEKHAQVINRANEIMRSVVARAAAATNGSTASAQSSSANDRADAIWRGVQFPSVGPDAAVLQRNKDIISRFHKAIGTFDRNTFYQLLHPNFINHPNWKTTQVGAQALIDGLQPFHDAMPDLTIIEEYVLAQRNRVATRITTSGTHLGTLMGMPPTGKRVSFTGIVIYRFDDDGKIVERWQDFDSAALMQQIAPAS